MNVPSHKKQLFEGGSEVERDETDDHRCIAMTCFRVPILSGFGRFYLTIIVLL